MIALATLAPLLAGAAAFLVAGLLWARRGQGTTQARLPPAVFMVVWPLIYVSLAYVALRPGRQSAVARAAVALYLVLSYVWIALPGRGAAGFLLIFGMLWAALTAMAAALTPADRILTALPIAWTAAALVLAHGPASLSST